MAPEWITIREAAEISGYHIEHVRRLIRADRVKAKKMGERRGPKHKA
jgi:excisionase family DNA binding protein